MTSDVFPMGYTKLFSRILGSTIWLEDDPTRILWITMLVMADQDGYVFASIPGLASQAHISLETCKRALKKFESPDQYSSTPTDDGRRVRRVEGGWLLVNHDKYHDMMSREDRLEKQRERQKRYRQRQESKRCDAGDVTRDAADAADVSVTQMTTTEQNRTDADNKTPSRELENVHEGKNPGTELFQLTPSEKRNRHQTFRQWIEKAYAHYNRLACPWDGGEAKQLKNFLAANPTMTEEQFKQCLNNKMLSDDRPKGERAREFLPRLTCYLSGQLDRYGKPRGNSDGRPANPFGEVPPPLANAVEIKRKQQAEARARGDID